MTDLVNGIFSNDSAFGRAMNAVWVTVIASVLFALTTLPVFTIGAGLCGLNYVMIRYRRGELSEKGVVKTFFEGFKSNFRQGTIAGLVLTGLFVLLYLENFWCTEFGGIFLTFRCFLFGTFVVLVCIALELFPAMVTFNGSLRELVYDAVFFAFAKPLRLLGILASLVLPVYVTVANPAYVPLTGFLWVCCLTGIITYVAAALLLPVYAPYLAALDATDSAQNPAQPQEVTNGH